MYDPIADIDRLIDAAKVAPSVLNTQPWSFQIVAGDRIDLHSNRDRWLPNIDPKGRELVISCGAALFNLRMAVRTAGHDLVVWLKPDKETPPDLLASVEIVTARVHPPTVIEQRLYEAIPLRHTNRQPFAEKPVGLNVVAELERVAWQERAYVWLLHQRMTRTLLDEIEKANGKEKKDPEWGPKFQQELKEYTNEPKLSEGLGIPHWAFGPLPANARHFRHHYDATGAPLAPGVPYRDLGFKWDPHDAPEPRDREKIPFEKHTRLLGLATDTNEPPDWLRAGQGLQRVLLTATRYNVAASFYTQPLEPSNEDPQFRRKNAWWPWPRFPQMVIRVGHCNSDTERMANRLRLPNYRLCRDLRA